MNSTAETTLTPPHTNTPEMGELSPYQAGPVLTQAMLASNGVALEWQDGLQTTLPLLWLRDHRKPGKGSICRLSQSLSHPTLRC